MKRVAGAEGQKNLRAALPRGDAEDLLGNRSLDASCREPRTLFLRWTKHIAEGAGFGSNPSWLPLHKTKIDGITLQ